MSISDLCPLIFVQQLQILILCDYHLLLYTFLHFAILYQQISGQFNETVSKTLQVNFDQHENNGADLITYWNEGTADTIVSTITIDGNDPDYDFPRICDSTATIFLFRMINMNITEMSGVCFKAQLTFAKYSNQCSHETNSTIDQTDEKTLQTFLIIAIGCLVICLALINIFITINRILKFRYKNHSKIKRISMSKASISNTAPLNRAENSHEFVGSHVLPISIASTSLNMMKSPTELFIREHILSPNSSFCYSVA
ncbi:Uncharacterized protein ACO02O_07761 [Dirofilaria immitis]